ncbi:protein MICRORCHIDIA 6-like [Durio zibethinus]|uniref:Protein MICRORCHIDIA 6-like n=1 Tax=Durio zibethinus TaxID=66656 RepID=A0A6P5YP61_DURZI|nr:protein MICRORCHIDIA 6-like [Durio zibethinus]
MDSIDNMVKELKAEGGCNDMGLVYKVGNGRHWNSKENRENRHIEACNAGNGNSINESFLSTPPASCFRPICRQFWRAGNYEVEDRSGLQAAKQDGRNQLHVHPMFLHSNATSHKSVFGAIAELLDNALDEVRNEATFVYVDKISNPRDESPALLIQDDGSGMDPEALRHCMSFGFSDKKMKHAIGQYGNGFKTGSMRLGADVIVFSRQRKMRTLTQSIGLLSYTFLRQMGYERIIVPMVNYEFDLSTNTFGPMLEHAKENFSSNLSMLLKWSPYTTEGELLKQFDDIGHHGTKIVIYNLWLNNDGDMELDFDSDPEDIRINGHPKIPQGGDCDKPGFHQHVANRYHYSLRAYLSILYLRLPQCFNVILRRHIVEHHNIANDLKFPEFILYKPQTSDNEAVVVTTVGFVKEAPCTNIHGYCIYHRNRLILPFWNGRKETTNSLGRGVVGFLEANFIEPTHNKQDFEKTSLFQKLTVRLKQMTQEYWRLHCELIGYQPVRRTKVPLSSQESWRDFAVPKRKRSAMYRAWSRQGSNMKSKKLNPPETDIGHHGELLFPESSVSNRFSTIYGSKNYFFYLLDEESLLPFPYHIVLAAWKKTGESSGTFRDNGSDARKQKAVVTVSIHYLCIRFCHFPGESIRVLELEKAEKELNMKVQQLQNELQVAQHEYTMQLLLESKSLNIPPPAYSDHSTLLSTIETWTLLPLETKFHLLLSMEPSEYKGSSRETRIQDIMLPSCIKRPTLHFL